MSVELVEVPCGLGLLPRGVERASTALQAAGLADRLSATRIHRVGCVEASDDRDAETGLLRPLELAQMATRLADAIDAVLTSGSVPVVVGGDCSNVLGSMLALRRRGRYGLLYVDGHADFWHPTEDDLGEAASVDLALATGRGPELLTDLEGLKPLVRDEDVAIVGYRSSVNDAFLGQHVRDTQISVHGLAEIREDGLERCLTHALNTVSASPLDGFWLHFDVDVLDDSIMPAVDYREPGGLSWSEARSVIRAAAASGRMVGMQVTIYNPMLDEPGWPLANGLVELLATALPDALADAT
jgi:arginase